MALLLRLLHHIEPAQAAKSTIMAKVTEGQRNCVTTWLLLGSVCIVQNITFSYPFLAKSRVWCFLKTKTQKGTIMLSLLLLFQRLTVKALKNAFIYIVIWLEHHGNRLYGCNPHSWRGSWNWSCSCLLLFLPSPCPCPLAHRCGSCNLQTLLQF